MLIILLLISCNFDIDTSPLIYGCMLILEIAYILRGFEFFKSVHILKDVYFVLYSMILIIISFAVDYLIIFYISKSYFNYFYNQGVGSTFLDFCFFQLLFFSILILTTFNQYLLLPGYLLLLKQ